MSTTLTEQERMLAIAKCCVTWGFVPIPVNGKKPFMKDWQLTTIDRALSKISGKTNIGILTGSPSNIVVLDIDVADNGLIVWNTVVTQPLTTFTVQTGGGGLHLYFKYDDNTRLLSNGNRMITCNGVKIGWDFRSTGGQVVFAGSKHETGNMYYPVAGFDKEYPVIETMPDWLFGILRSGGFTLQ